MNKKSTSKVAKHSRSHSSKKSHAQHHLSPLAIVTLVGVVLVMFFLIAGTWWKKSAEELPGMFQVTAPTPTPDYSRPPKGFSGVRLEPKGSGTKLTITTWNNSTSPLPAVTISPAPASIYPKSFPIPTRTAGQTATTVTVPYIQNGTWKWTGLGGSGDVVLGWGNDPSGKCYIVGTIDPDMIIKNKSTGAIVTPIFNIPLAKFYWPVNWTGSGNIVVEAHDPTRRVNGVMGSGPLMGLVEVSNAKCTAMTTVTTVQATATRTPTRTPTRTATPVMSLVTAPPTLTPVRPTNTPPVPTPTVVVPSCNSASFSPTTGLPPSGGYRDVIVSASNADTIEIYDTYNGGYAYVATFPYSGGSSQTYSNNGVPFYPYPHGYQIEALRWDGTRYLRGSKKCILTISTNEPTAPEPKP